MSEDLARVPRAVEFVDGRLLLIDQTRLPGEVVTIRPDTLDAVVEAIRMLRVRGAPAIGIAAAYGLAQVTRAHPRDAIVESAAAELKAARPTAVNLAWAVDRCVEAWRRRNSWQDLHDEACAIHAEDETQCRAIGEFGAPLIADGSTVLTHCNAGALAVSMLGTALAPIYVAHAEGRRVAVIADETRPLLQGARLTAWELTMAGVPTTVICDNMAATHMQRGDVDLVIVGTDRVTANGDVVNKIGTLGVAILARHFGIPFYVALPASTFDAATADGAAVPIEERARTEVAAFGGLTTTPDAAGVANPAFDVTPAELVTAFITDRGILEPPFADSLGVLRQ